MQQKSKLSKNLGHDHFGRRLALAALRLVDDHFGDGRSLVLRVDHLLEGDPRNGDVLQRKLPVGAASLQG